MENKYPVLLSLHEFDTMRLILQKTSSMEKTLVGVSELGFVLEEGTASCPGSCYPVRLQSPLRIDDPGSAVVVDLVVVILLVAKLRGVLGLLDVSLLGFGTSRW